MLGSFVRWQQIPLPLARLCCIGNVHTPVATLTVLWWLVKKVRKSRIRMIGLLTTTPSSSANLSSSNSSTSELSTSCAELSGSFERMSLTFHKGRMEVGGGWVAWQHWAAVWGM
jgi:hypothetical protein